LSRRARVIRTPEHIDVELRPAGPGSRFLAFLVDASFALAVALFLQRLLDPFVPEGLGLAVWLTLQFVIGWGYHIYFETRRAGRSPGKQLLGLRVVDGRGFQLGVEQSFVRNTLRVLDAAPVFYGLGGLVALFDAAGRRLGDLAADTLVVRETFDQQALARTLGGGDATSLRVPRVVRQARRRIGLEEREFLTALCLRADALEPRARFDLFESVAADYRQRLQLEEDRLSGEKLVRGVASILFWDRRHADRRQRA